MDLSIIIVNWNTSALLIQCLDSIYQAAPRLTFEIIVVDNGSTDDSVKIIKTYFPSVHIIGNSRNVGFARANNQGLAIAKGRYSLLLNSDTLVLPNALDKLVHYADEHLEAGMVGPKMLNIDGSLQESWAKFPAFWSEITGRTIRNRRPIGDPPHAYDVDWVSGAGMLVRSKMVDSVGMLDEDYFFYSEEVDWCFRIKAKGWKVHYLPASEIFHIGGGSASMNSLRQLSLLYQNKIRFFNKNYGSFKALLLRYGLVFANFYGIIRRLPFPYWVEGNATRHRIIIQSQLIWCLIRNQYPAANN
jgi:GT2 family glycosyltransferase